MTLTETTKQEIAGYEAAGCERLTVAEFESRLHAIGYRRDRAAEFAYVNTLNEHTYRARSVCYYKEKDTGIGFANVNARRDSNLGKLQELRRNSLVVSAGRLWEL